MKWPCEGPRFTDGKTHKKHNPTLEEVEAYMRELGWLS